MRQNWVGAVVASCYDGDDRVITKCDLCERHRSEEPGHRSCPSQVWCKEIECVVMWANWERRTRAMQELNRVLLRIAV